MDKKHNVPDLRRIQQSTKIQKSKRQDAEHSRRRRKTKRALLQVRRRKRTKTTHYSRRSKSSEQTNQNLIFTKSSARVSVKIHKTTKKKPKTYIRCLQKKRKEQLLQGTGEGYRETGRSRQTSWIREGDRKKNEPDAQKERLEERNE